MFIALVLAAATSAWAPPDGTYTYTSTMNGAQIGKTAITVKRSAQTIVLTEAGSGSMNGENGSVQDTLTVDAQLAPSTYTADASLADSRNMRSSVAFSPTQAQQTGDVTKTYPLAGASKHFVLMDVGPFSGFFMIPAQMHAWNGAAVTAIVPNFAHSITLAPDGALPPARPANVPKNDKAYSFDSMVQLTVWYDPATLVVDEVDVPAQGLVVVRQPK